MVRRLHNRRPSRAEEDPHRRLDRRADLRLPGLGLYAFTTTSFLAAQRKVSQQRVQELDQAVARYVLDTRHCPRTMADLVAMGYVERARAEGCPGGRTSPSPAPMQERCVRSAGRDRVFDTADDITTAAPSADRTTTMIAPDSTTIATPCSAASALLVGVALTWTCAAFGLLLVDGAYLWLVGAGKSRRCRHRESGSRDLYASTTNDVPAHDDLIPDKNISSEHGSNGSRGARRSRTPARDGKIWRTIGGPDRRFDAPTSRRASTKPLLTAAVGRTAVGGGRAAVGARRRAAVQLGGDRVAALRARPRDDVVADRLGIARAGIAARARDRDAPGRDPPDRRASAPRGSTGARLARPADLVPDRRAARDARPRSRANGRRAPSASVPCRRSARPGPDQRDQLEDVRRRRVLREQQLRPRLRARLVVEQPGERRHQRQQARRQRRAAEQRTPRRPRAAGRAAGRRAARPRLGIGANLARTDAAERGRARVGRLRLRARADRLARRRPPPSPPPRAPVSIARRAPRPAAPPSPSRRSPGSPGRGA